MDAILQTEAISYHYGHSAESMVFQDISLSVQKGQVFCLLGPNGIGKSTLLKCVGGILHIRKGRVLIDGRNLTDYRLPELARTVGYVPQGLVSAFPFRIKDIVLMGRAPHLNLLASPSDRDRELAHIAMDRVGILHLADRPSNAVSGGEWQLTLIARALVQQPKILILDEPTSHLDMGNQMKILRVVRDMAKDGMTVLMATHFPDHASLVADVVAILNKGRILKTGPPDFIITEENMQATYGVKVRMVELDSGKSRKGCFPEL